MKSIVLSFFVLYLGVPHGRLYIDNLTPNDVYAVQTSTNFCDWNYVMIWKADTTNAIYIETDLSQPCRFYRVEDLGTNIQVLF